MEIILVLSIMVGGLIGVVNRNPLIYPSNKTIAKWEGSTLEPKVLLMELTNEKCYQNYMAYLACVASIDRMGYHLGVRVIPPGKITGDFSENLIQPERLPPWKKYFTPHAPTINFQNLAQDLFFKKTPIKSHKFITAMGINGLLSIQHDPHTYIKPLDEDDWEEEDEINPASDELTLDELEKLTTPELITPMPIPPLQPSSTPEKKVIGLSLSKNPEIFSMINIKEFSRGACLQFQTALKKVIRHKSEKIIIDLQGNPGGLVDEVVCIASLLVGKKKIVTLKHFSGQVENLEGPLNQLFYGEIQVFIDNASASSSEILAGCLQSYHRGQIIGDISFGKGTFQSSSYEKWSKYQVSFMKTQGYFFFPNGLSPQLKGIQPNKTGKQVTGGREKDLFLFPLEAP